MTKMEKYIAGMGVCISGLLVFAVAAFNGSNDKTSKTTAQSAPAFNGTTSLQNQAPDFRQSPALHSAPATSAPVVVAQIDPLPANATYVPDGNLQQLSVMVNLAEATVQAPDKKQWTEAVAVAQKLMEGPCDCAQRVWLKNFIAMGNYALSGSTSQYQ